MTRAPNPARGEVEIVLGGQTYILAGTFQGMARLQGALGVEGLAKTLALVAASDPRALYHGVVCLAVDGDTERLGGMSFVNSYDEVREKLIAAISGPEPAAGNAGGGETEK